MSFCIRRELKSLIVLMSPAMLALQLTLAVGGAARAQDAVPNATATPSESVIYSFGLGSSSNNVCTNILDGAAPKGSLTFANGFLFGRTSTTTAKPAGDGIIFHIMPNGSDYTIDHIFTGATTDGNNPRHNAMTLVNNVLYGTTLNGGLKDNGTIFSILDDGTGYSAPIYDFQKSSANNDGDQPHSCFEAAGNGLLYGMTSQGGNHGGATGDGTIFSFDPNGAVYTKLFSFDGTKHGSDPHGQPILDPDGVTLYGMTRAGGKAGVGVIFSFDTSTGKFKTLHKFTCPGGKTPSCVDSNGGATPDHGTLVQSGTTLFGLTTFGGKNGNGTVFSIENTGKHFKVLHSFGKPGSNDGSGPFGSLMLSGSMLYGTTRDGGKANLGTVFQIDTKGNHYDRLYDFKAKPDGANPIDNVILVSNTLYGMTEAGGKCDQGAIFAIALP
ncbi:MAG TPA: choice-of-anchor tandem repeat GloVer-containing protein [Candidatus Acidoferrales bacterium]|nr:choice-of-anchor tandem repeat GloVer-containing protein [Candidatus Acidoferrales bacterium]